MIPGTVLAPSLWHLILLWYQVPGTRYTQESEKAGKNKNEMISWQQWHTTIHHDDGKRHQKIEEINCFSNKFLSSFFYYCYRRLRKVFLMFDSDCGLFFESKCKFDCRFLRFFRLSFSPIKTSLTQ